MAPIVGDRGGYGNPMLVHEVRVQRAGERFPRERELAWQLAEVARDPAPVEPEVAEMVGNRLLDDVAVAVAALDREPLAAMLVEEGLRRLRDEGTQAGLVDRMQTRGRLYELLRYAEYTAFDQDVHDFEL